MMCCILLPVFIVKCVKLILLNCIHNNTIFIVYYDFSPVYTKFCEYMNWTRSRDSIVGIATSYRLDNRGVGVRVPVGSRIFSTSSRPVLGSIQWVPGALSLGVKRPGREADHLPPASAEVKKMWIYTSTPPYAFRRTA
jgi:hypothetical protein